MSPQVPAEPLIPIEINDTLVAVPNTLQGPELPNLPMTNYYASD